MAIDRPEFAAACVRQAIRFGVNPHYLIACAQLRSGISDQHQGDRFSAFRLTQTEWDANSSDAERGISDFLPEDVAFWDMQCVIYALMTLRAQNRLLEKLGRFPSAVELYKEQWPADTVTLPDALQTALDNTRALIEPAVTAVLGAPAADAPEINNAGASAPGLVIATPTLPSPTQGDETFVAKAPGIMERLIDDFDLRDFQAAAILGNIGHECAGFRLMQEVKPIGGGRGGFGWCQWTADRRIGFEDFCRSNGLDPTSDAANYGNLKRELTETSEKAAIPAVKGTTNIEDAVKEFELKFERAGVKHYDRRNRWANLALAVFSQGGRRLPSEVSRLLDPDLSFQILATAKDGTTTYWVVDQFTDGGGGQVLLRQRAGEAAAVLANDTSVFPIEPGLVPPAVAATLSAGSAAAQPHKPVVVPVPTSDTQVSQRVFAQAKASDETLVSRNASGTNNGRLACAWAVNEVVNNAIGKPVGGGLSTIKMAEVLKAKHAEVASDSQISAGMVVISPTQGGNVGHVGIVGEIKSPLSDTVIYSNSSSRAVFSHHFTMAKWRSFYGTKKGLPVRFYALRA